jgi:predicted membrane chloride channel (bestrophin family)
MCMRYQLRPVKSDISTPSKDKDSKADQGQDQGGNQDQDGIGIQINIIDCHVKQQKQNDDNIWLPVECKGLLNEEEIKYLQLKTHRANALLLQAAKVISKGMQTDECLDTILYSHLMSIIDRLGGIQGACERIFSTPLPYPYTLLVFRTSYMFILLAPFAMAKSMGYFSIIFNALIAYTFFGLDELARCLENPFGYSPFDLALETMCRFIHISMLEALDEHAPLPLQPSKGGLLM